MMRIFQRILRYLLFSLTITSLLLLIGAIYSLMQCFVPALHANFVVRDFACEYSPADFSPLLVALGYWIAGAVSWRVKKSPSIVVFFLLGAVALATGLLSASVIWIAENLFYISLSLLSPLILHFHLRITGRPLRSFENSSLFFFYLLGGLLTLPFFLSADKTVLQPYLWTVRIFFVTAVLWTCLLLITSYNHFSYLSARRRTRMVAFGSLFAFAPLVFLSVLPQTLRIEKIDFVFTFPGLLTVPIVFGYLESHDAIRLTEKRFRQVWVYYLLGITLLSIYNLSAGLLRSTLAQQTWLYTGGISAILLIILFVPLHHLLDRLVLWIFYGSETDYAQAVYYLGKTLASVIDRETLKTLLLEELVAAIHPSRTVLYLRQRDEKLHWIGGTGIEDPTAFQQSFFGQGRFAQLLLDATGPMETRRVLEIMQGQPLEAAEGKLLAAPDVALWLPMVSKGCLYGLLLLGVRAGDDRFTEEDQRLLGQVMHQAGAAIRNVIMAEDLRAGQEELALANQKLILNQEQERRRLARELHDDTVQQLLGLSFRLSGIRKRALKAEIPAAVMKPLAEDLELARRDLLDVVSQLRGMIGELRPAGLDELGLRVAIEGYIEQVRKLNEPRGGLPVPEVVLHMTDNMPNLSDALAICVFRTLQEALRNALQHAQAAQINIRLDRVDGSLCLTVRDNGRGFQPPDRLSELTLVNHYGLVGVWERVRAAGGEFAITSTPGMGTCLRATLPLEEKHDEQSQ